MIEYKNLSKTFYNGPVYIRNNFEYLGIPSEALYKNLTF